WKIATANVSDIVACGGKPSACLSSLGVPPDFPPAVLEAIYDGLADAARHYGFDVVGGNVSAASELWIDLFMLGKAPRFISRGGAKPGDLVVVTGAIGDAAAGFDLLQSRRRGREDPPYAEALVNKHLRPQARLDLVDPLRAAASAAIDISDGLASELHRLAERSKVQISIDAGRIPMSAELTVFATDRQIDPLRLALSSGEEYQLVFTLPKGGNLAPFGGRGTRIIGEVRAGSGVLLDGAVLEPLGWDHLKAGP
ncbi:MAG TPA: thiamine-phosphate kinase, partial [bacterium]